MDLLRLSPSELRSVVRALSIDRAVRHYRREHRHASEAEAFAHAEVFWPEFQGRVLDLLALLAARAERDRGRPWPRSTLVTPGTSPRAAGEAD